jgi:acetolactate synthase-1/2/3 large subunit
MVRQWQEMFFSERYSFTPMKNPNFVALASAYGIAGAEVKTHVEFDEKMKEMFSDDKAFLLVADVEEKGMVFPMTPAGTTVTNILVNKNMSK